MKKHHLLLITSVLVSGPVFAEKPEWAGNGKPTAEQKATHKAAMQSKDDLEEKESEIKNKINEAKPKQDKAAKKQKEDKVVNGLEKEKKTDQIQKELGKGSEQGQEASSKKKKWWKFWE